MVVLMDTEKGLTLLGNWSRWQVMMYFVVSCNYFFASWHMLNSVFYGLKPTHHCEVPAGISYEDAIPAAEEGGLEECEHYLNYSKETNITVEGCPLGWHLGDEAYTIVHEWNAVCDRKYLVTLSQTILVVGVMLGAMVMSSLADRFGRKNVVVGSVLAISLCGFGNAWVQHYWLFCVFRFFVGFFQQGIVLAGFVYSCELFPAADRTVAGLCMQIFWGFGMFLLALFAYLIRNWRHLMLTISVPGLLVIPLFWLLPESIPYLVARGRLREAKEVLNKAAKFNGITLPKEFQLTEEDEVLLGDKPRKPSEPSRRRSSVAVAMRKMSRVVAPDGEIYQYTFLDVVKSRRLLMFSLMMAYIWCTSALVYYGLSLSTGALAGNAYLNFFLSGLVEIPAYLICAVVLQLIGRRWPIFTFHMIAGIPLFITLFIPKTTSGGTDLSPLIVTLAMIGKFGITGCFGSVFLYAPELFPTTIRSLGIGIASVGSRVGNLIAPQTELVMEYISWLPNVVFGVMCILAGIVTLLLPETLGRPLPQTIKEVEHWSRTLSPEEKARFKEAKRAEKEKRKRLLEEEMQPVNS